MPELVWSLIYPGRGSQDQWAPPIAPGAGPADYSVHWEHSSALWFAYDWLTFRESGSVTYADFATQAEAKKWCEARHAQRAAAVVQVETVDGRTHTVPADAAPTF